MPSEAAPVRMVSVANMHSLKTAILHNKRLIAACIALPLVLALLFVIVELLTLVGFLVGGGGEFLALGAAINGLKGKWYQ